MSQAAGTPHPFNSGYLGGYCAVPAGTAQAGTAHCSTGSTENPFGYCTVPDPLLGELILLDGAAETIGELKRLGFQICIVTNQSAIFRELWDEDRLHEIHSELSRIMLSIDPDAFIDLIVTCPHRHFDRCSCRKPMPGMLYLGDQILRSNLVLPLKLNKNVNKSTWRKLTAFWFLSLV